MKKEAATMHIAIAGNIGAGKTTLTGILAKHYGWEAHYEEVDGNPYLNDFYHDMQRWSFNLQVYFLNKRFSQIIDFRHSGKTVIQDRTIYEDAEIFAPNLHEMGLMSTRDFETYRTLFDLMGKLIQAPDLIIYLRASIPTLVQQIQKRGRDYEDSIRLDYLKQLNQRYEAWSTRYRMGKMLVINVDELNFADNKGDMSKVIDRIDAQLHGLF
jgi:deoxyadenosine/deoxycytidine kinase